MPQLGLREQKKWHTEQAIQYHALQLFHIQGYRATSIADIANAAGISEATFYRYFPTKEDVVLQDNYDPLLLAVFQQQPPKLTPLQALRATFKQVLGSLTETDRQAQHERLMLIISEPKLRAHMLDQFTVTMQLLVKPLAQRSGRQEDDFAVVTVAGALMGACIATLEILKMNPDADFVELLDTAVAQLEPGLTL